MAGKLYLCATPIGNLEDITFRVLNTLKEVDLIAAEDTRHSIKLLNHFGIKTPMTSYHEFNKVEKARYLVEQLKEGVNIAVVTDAGTPGISDPGEELVRQCYEAGIEVTSLPGPAACITALTMSGLATRRFCFEAFLPSEKKEKQWILDELKNESRTIIIYEAPHRLVRTLEELKETLGNRRLTICRELTKKYEEAYQTTFEEALARYEVEEPKGECVLVIEGKSIAQKKEELAKAETELAQTRREIKTDKLKGVAVNATTKAVERIGALFHDPKPARYEKQIADLQGVIADKDKCIGQLQQEIKTMQAGHDKEVANLKQEAQQVIKALMRVDELCPYVKGLLKWENYCKDVGLDKERTKALFTMQPYRYTGELHSIRYNHTFRANDVILQFKPDKDGPSGFQFTINGKDCDEWFRQQRKEFYERIGIDIEQTEQRRGMKM